jgi:hypothetical protein
LFAVAILAPSEGGGIDQLTMLCIALNFDDASSRIMCFFGLLIGTSKHHPNGGSTEHLDNDRLTDLIAAYQTRADP